MKVVIEGSHQCQLSPFNSRPRYENGVVVQCSCGIYYRGSVSDGEGSFIYWRKLSKRRIRKLRLTAKEGTE